VCGGGEGYKDTLDVDNETLKFALNDLLQLAFTTAIKFDLAHAQRLRKPNMK